MGNLTLLSGSVSRSISPENFTGAKGAGAQCELEDGSAKWAARDLGKGWKVNPYIRVAPGETFEIANIQGPGAIQHIWMTPTGKWRDTILRMYWDGQAAPSVECPVGDFFCCGWQEYHQVSTLAVCVNPGSAFNCYWTMPFRQQCRITLENRGEEEAVYYYQIDYTLGEVPQDAAYFHAQFRRVNPCPTKRCTPSWTGCRARATTWARTWPGACTTTAGGGRGDKILPGRRPGGPHHLRHRHRGLLLRLLQF